MLVNQPTFSAKASSGLQIVGWISTVLCTITFESNLLFNKITAIKKKFMFNCCLIRKELVLVYFCVIINENPFAI